MEKKDYKPIIAIALVLVLGLVGGTVAYFTTNSTFENTFKTKPYGSEITESFESPDNWTPGTTTSKTVVAKNTGDVDIAVRVSYEEKWVPASGTGTLPLLQNGNRVAILNLANQSDWKLDNGYYYYHKKLSKNQVTSSFLESVTFNPNVVASSETNCTESADHLVKNCQSTGNGYDGATYTLTIKVETIQFDAYQTAWTNAVTITE